MAVDVFQYHNRVVHHQTNRQHQRQKREGVDGKTKQRHQRKSANQADWNGHQRNDGRAEGAQKHKDHQGHQHHRFGNGLVHRLDGTVDENRVVVGHFNLHARRQVLFDPVEQFAHTHREFQRVGGGLRNHAQRNGVAPVQPHGGAFVQRPLLHRGYIGNADGLAIDGTNHHLGKLRRCLQVGGRRHVEFALPAFNATRWHFQVATAQGVFHILRGQPVGGQAAHVDGNAHRITALAAHQHIRGPRRRLQYRLDQPVGKIRKLQRGMGIRAHCQPDHRVGIGLDLGDHRLVNVLGQPLAHARDLVTHIGRSRIGVAAERKTNRNLALLLPADGGDHIHPLNAGQRVFQHLGDLRLNHLAGGTGKAGGYRDHGLVDLGVLAYRQRLVGHQTNQQHQQRQHRGKHRPAYRYFRQLHGGS